VKRRFRQLADAAALAADCHVDVEFSGGSMTMKDNPVLLERWVANMTAYGIPDNEIDFVHLGSSDMGNVSHALPTIHPYLAICDEGVPGHSIEFRDAAVTPRADETTLLAATLVAQTAWDLFADPALVEAAWREFRGG
jgi:metal-dependent amidase/aminoacylase/carboxypeptidase family protein